MKSKQIKLLQNLIKIPSPSGFEKKFAEFIKKTLLNYLPRTRVNIDFHNNTIATIKGSNPSQVIMIDAHLDQLGLLVNNIDKDGNISLIQIGGHDISLLRGRKVFILTKKSIIKGVINSKPIHLIDEEKDEIPEKTTDLNLDIGIRKKKQVDRYISIGDPVVLEPLFSQLVDDFYTGSGFDDKTGVFILMETIREIMKSKKKPVPTLKFVFTSQEELGCKGAKELVNRYNPKLFVGLDVVFATDQINVDEKEAGKCRLGDGIVVHKGINIFNKANDLLIRTAKRNKIKLQYQATKGQGTNAAEVASENGGIRIMDLGIPLRNMHTTVEIVSLSDLNSSVKLLKTFLLNRKLGKILENEQTRT